MIGHVVANAIRSSVSRPDESGSHRSARTRSNMLERSSSSASSSVCAAWSSGCPESPATQRRTSAAKSGSSSRRRTLTVCSTWSNSGAACMAGTHCTGQPAGTRRRLTNPHLSASGYETFWQARAEICNLSRPRPPHPGSARVLDAVPEGSAQSAQPERLAKHVGVDRDIHHERVALALLDHLVELVDDHVAEVGGVLLAVDDHLRVVELDRVWNREQRPRARTQPHRLVVHRPVHEVLVAELLQEVGGMGRLVGTGPQPADRRRASWRAIVSVTSRRMRSSSGCHRPRRFSALVRPCPITSSPRLRIASMICGAYS